MLYQSILSKFYTVQIFKEKPGVVSKRHLWICFHSCFMYTGDTFIQLLFDMYRYWKHDYKMIG